MLEAYDNEELDPRTDPYIGKEGTHDTGDRSRRRKGGDSGNVPESYREDIGGGTVRKNNPAASALQRFQKQMNGEAEKSGLFSEEDVADWITESRRKGPDEC